jgi:ATP sulfurylase
MQVNINEETLQDIINLEVGLFNPLKGFMDSKDYISVVNENRLANGEVFTLPITFDIDEFKAVDEIEIFYKIKK